MGAVTEPTPEPVPQAPVDPVAGGAGRGPTSGTPSGSAEGRPAGPTSEPTVATSRALLEVLDRDGQARQSFPVQHWPLRLGRALDNDVVLSDPHVAATHLQLAPQSDGVALTVGDTVNGVLVGPRRWRTGERALLPLRGAAVEMTVGRTRLRLRLPGQPLAAELPVGAAAGSQLGPGSVVLAAALLTAALVFNTYLDTDPETLGRALAAMLLASLSATMVWCGLWALLSKMFTHQARFGWHLRVFLWASLAWMAMDMLPRLAAFMFSWPAPSSFSFVGTLGIGAVAFYFHLLGVDPARPRLLRRVALVGWVVGVVVMLWFNVQRADRLGEELYMNHLFPPALRLARPVAPETFIEGLRPLQPLLDKKSKEAPVGDSNGGTPDEE